MARIAYFPWLDRDKELDDDDDDEEEEEGTLDGLHEICQGLINDMCEGEEEKEGKKEERMDMDIRFYV